MRLLLALLAAPALSQAPPPAAAPADDDPYPDKEIVVRGQKPPGSVVGDIAPEVVLGPSDIRSYGVNNISDLLDELAPQTGSDRGRGGGAPVVLLNGRRVSGFGEIRDLPTEAIQRVEILPEEVSLKYGYAADQRVVNIVLRRRFRALVGQAGGGVATEGGGASANPEANLVRIQGDRRLSVNLRYQDSAAIRESERGVADISPARPGDPDGVDLSRYRTLRGASRTVSTNIVYAHPVFARATATVNGSLSHQADDALRGLPFGDLVPPDGAADPLHQRTATLTGHLGLGLTGDRGRWRWSLTGNYDRADVRTHTQTGIDPGGLPVDRARAVTNSGDLQAVANGPVMRLPAGPLGTTIKVGVEESGFDGSSLRAGLARSGSLNRRNANGQVNLDLPIASRKEDVLSAIGNLTANFNVAVRQLSDFGTLRTLGYGLHWVPVAAVDLIASITDDQGAPTLQQLDNPLVATPQVRVFDYRAGTTVDVTQSSGGNRALHADDRRVAKLGLTLKPFPKNDLTIVADYLRTRTRNAIATLPEPTADIEDAFPDRFVRDAAGTLIRIDSSPVNFAREARDELRFGFNVSISLKSVMQRKFDEWIAARRAGKDVPPPFTLPDRFRRRADAAARPGGQADGAPPPPPDGGPPPEGGPPPGGGGFGGPPGGGFGQGGFGSGGGGGRRGGGGGFGGRNAGGRLQVAVYDTWTLRDTVLVRQGVAPIDLLRGGAVGSGGGQPEHKVEAQFGYANNGLGVRLSGTYQTGTEARSGGNTSGDLRFSELATANLRLFADLGQVPALVGKAWARGARVSLELNNIADSRQHVRDATGGTPLRYQPAYLDPLGRTVRVTLRKLLF